METYHGHVRTPGDAIVLFEACRLGTLPRVQRRLSEKERQSIKSGSVFVWDEREAGMRRWTDGKSWSASRVSGSFLTYREMEGKRGGRSDSDVDMGGADEGPDGYRYKPDGLMKQSFSITTSTGNHLHLISYYARSSPQAAQLQQPGQDPSLRHIRPPKGMYPESTVQEHSSIPAVTRSPMAGQMAVPQQYASRGGPSPPQNGGYGDPHMYQRPWPVQTTSAPNGYPAYPPTSVPPNAAGYASHPPPPGYAHAMPPFAQPAAATSAPAYDPNMPRPGVPTHHRSNSGSSLGPGSYASSRPSPHSGVATLAPPTSASRQASQTNSPAGTPPSHQIDPRLMAPGANSLPPVHHARHDGSGRTPSPIPRRDWSGTPASREGPNGAGAIPSIGHLVNGNRDHRASAGRSESGSPGRLREVQDIPHDKLGFREDMRALRVLDRAFKT